MGNSKKNLGSWWDQNKTVFLTLFSFKSKERNEETCRENTLLQPQTWDVLPRGECGEEREEMLKNGPRPVGRSPLWEHHTRSPCSPCPVTSSRGATATPRSLGYVFSRCVPVCRRQGKVEVEKVARERRQRLLLEQESVQRW